LAAKLSRGPRTGSNPEIQLGGLRGLEGLAAAAAAAANLKAKQSSAKAKLKVPQVGLAFLSDQEILVKNSMATPGTKPSAPAEGASSAGAQAAIRAARTQQDEIVTEFAALGTYDVAALATQNTSITSKSGSGNTAKNSSSRHELVEAANKNVQKRSELIVVDDESEPLNSEKADQNTSRSIDAPEYAAAATQFQRRSSEKQIYDDYGEPATLSYEKEAIAAIPSVPDFVKAASQRDERSARENVYDENGEPTGLNVGISMVSEEANRKSAFAAKAAAYRRRKGNKEEQELSNEDEEGSKFRSTYRKNKKSQRVLYDDQKEGFGDEENLMQEEDIGTETGENKGAGAEDPRTTTHEATPGSSILAMQKAPGKATSPEPARDEPSLARFLERDQMNTGLPASKTNPEANSLDSFFERQVSLELRSEVLRQNFDDSSVAIMADRLEKKAMDDSEFGDPANWNEGGGISDFMGWANQAIQASDSESVRGFEISRNLDYQHDYDDDSTIATYYDDDASIVSSTMTPRQKDVPFISFDRPGDFGPGDVSQEFDQGIELQYDAQYDGQFDAQYDDHFGGQYDDNVPSVTAKVAASILFNDSETDSSVDQSRAPPSGGVRAHPVSGRDADLIDMALTFNDVGLDAGLSFGADVGFDDGLGFGGVEDSLGGFGGSGSQLHAIQGNAFSYGDHNGFESDDAPGASSHRPNSPKEGDDGIRRAGSKWFQWGKGK
jgi:hypothetical protein